LAAQSSPELADPPSGGLAALTFASHPRNSPARYGFEWIDPIRKMI
jgi:hypothetical protein